MAKWLYVRPTTSAAGASTAAVINIDQAARIEFAFVAGQPLEGRWLQSATVVMPDGVGYPCGQPDAGAVFDYVSHKDHNVGVPSRA